MLNLEWARETPMEGLLLPTLMLVFVGALALAWGLDVGLRRFGAYEVIWHPALFRVSLFLALFCAMALLIY
ncbi:DUF1656 domain-containing protein [Marinobacter sp. JSM 1782161]|uniref:DUF1656 domain-containing protein n=1 Tax=Marinobacter sp. JSM 1782161 TaxID=2685906 RepID=UPI001D18AB28|nr:DUF1656 domain-containing protein [Marinobacter sp. JSM 1782161]